MGNLEAEIFVDRAPVSAAAFMRNVDAGVYNDGRAGFYRVVHPDGHSTRVVSQARGLEAKGECEGFDTGFLAEV